MVNVVHLWTDQRIPDPVFCRCPEPRVFRWRPQLAGMWRYVLYHFRYAEDHDDNWIGWYQQYWEALYGSQKDYDLAQRLWKVYPGPPKGFYSQQRGILSDPRWTKTVTFNYIPVSPLPGSVLTFLKRSANAFFQRQQSNLIDSSVRPTVILNAAKAYNSRINPNSIQPGDTSDAQMSSSINFAEASIEPSNHPLSPSINLTGSTTKPQEINLTGKGTGARTDPKETSNVTGARAYPKETSNLTGARADPMETSYLTGARADPMETINLTEARTDLKKTINLTEVRTDPQETINRTGARTDPQDASDVPLLPSINISEVRIDPHEGSDDPLSPSINLSKASILPTTSNINSRDEELPDITIPKRPQRKAAATRHSKFTGQS